MKISQIGKSGKIGIISKHCSISHIAKAVSTGNRVYLSIRKLDCEYWGIHSGDLVHITIDEFKTPIEIKETEEE